MRKKYFLAKLAIYGFLTLGAATTFVGCKDYDGDITDLQTQIDEAMQPAGDDLWVEP